MEFTPASHWAGSSGAHTACCDMCLLFVKLAVLAQEHNQGCVLSDNVQGQSHGVMLVRLLPT